MTLRISAFGDKNSEIRNLEKVTEQLYYSCIITSSRRGGTRPSLCLQETGHTPDLK